MRFLGLILCVASTAACSAVGQMADTDGDTDTDTDTEGVSDSLSTSGMTTTPMTNTMSGTSNPTTNPSTTTDEPTSTTTEPATTEDTGCPPGTEGCPCDVGSTCEGELQCVDGTCVGEAACDEPEEEPNDAFDEAIDLGAIECSMDYATTDGALNGTDADFYALTQAMGGFCFDPGPQALVEADEDVRVCVYMTCDDGTGPVNCGPQEDDTYEEVNGCCGMNEAQLFNPGCPGIPFGPDPAYFIRVISANENACIPYTLSYRIAD